MVKFRINWYKTKNKHRRPQPIPNTELQEPDLIQAHIAYGGFIMKIRRTGMVAKKTNIHQLQHDVAVNNYSLLYHPNNVPNPYRIVPFKFAWHEKSWNTSSLLGTDIMNKQNIAGLSIFPSVVSSRSMCRHNKGNGLIRLALSMKNVKRQNK